MALTVSAIEVGNKLSLLGSDVLSKEIITEVSHTQHHISEDRGRLARPHSQSWVTLVQQAVHCDDVVRDEHAVVVVQSCKTHTTNMIIEKRTL